MRKKRRRRRRNRKLAVPLVERSCGCVFCDLGLETEPVNGQLVHRLPPQKYSRYEVYNCIVCPRFDKDNT